MSGFEEQTPLRTGLDFTRLDAGRYSIRVPPSVCFGTVALGGFVVSFIHRAAVDFTSRSPKTASHRHVHQISTNFCRPTLPAPREAVLSVKVANANKAWTTLHLEVTQGGKLCVAGYMTLTDLSRPGGLSVDTGWKLVPPPTPITVEALEADVDNNWISYLTPFDPKDFRRPQSYIKYYIPRQRSDRHILDQWVTPGWNDDGLPAGAIWTDELLHFIIDNSLPLLNDLGDCSIAGKLPLHENMIRAGLAQRCARAENRSERILGDGMAQEELFPYIISTLSVSTEIKKALPTEGVKWLFMRVVTKTLRDSKMDYDIVVLDEHMELVAVSQHVMTVVPVDMKRAKKERL